MDSFACHVALLIDIPSISATHVFNVMVKVIVGTATYINLSTTEEKSGRKQKQRQIISQEKYAAWLMRRSLEIRAATWNAHATKTRLFKSLQSSNKKCQRRNSTKRTVGRI